MHFVMLFGPPAVGKMTVGRELSRLTGYRLLHNHMTVEPVLDIFPFGSPPFTRLVGEFRRRILEEAIAAELPGLVFTMVWGLELADDRALVASYVDLVEASGGRVSFVELYASLEERLARNRTELRLSEKRSKRDLEFSDANVLDLEDNYVMNTADGSTLAEPMFAGRDYVRIDNTDLPPEGAAAVTLAALGLGAEPGPPPG
jgi:hypothetical protein